MNRKRIPCKKCIVFPICKNKFDRTSVNPLLYLKCDILYKYLSNQMRIYGYLEFYDVRLFIIRYFEGSSNE